MIPLERMFSATQKATLLSAAQQRYSCRQFGAELSTGEWAMLGYLAGRYALPGTRILLLRTEEGLWNRAALGRGIRGCKAVAVLTEATAVQGARIHAGIMGEAFCLEAVAKGFATCWGTAQEPLEQLKLPLQLGERVLALIALGHPAEQQEPQTRKLKSLQRLCEGEVALWPEEYQQAAAAVQLAPSIDHRQPWRITAKEDRLTIAADRSPLELGIAMTHAELALRTAHRWRIGLHSAWAVPIVKEG